MRVLHCRQSERIWGPERQIVSLAERLPSFGIELELVMFRRYGRLDPIKGHHDLLFTAKQLLAERPEQAKALGLAGQKHVRQAFPVDSMVESMASLYQKMVFPGSARAHVEDHDPARISASL